MTKPSIQRKSRRYVTKNGISKKRPCAVCGEVHRCVIHVVDDSNEYQVVFICRSCLASWTASKELPSLSYRESISVDLRNLKKNVVKAYSSSAFRQKRKRFLNHHSELKNLPCQHCGDSSRESFYYTASDIPEPNPLIVRRLCRSCKGKYPHLESHEKKNPLDLRLLAENYKASQDIQESSSYRDAAERVTQVFIINYQPALVRKCQYCDDNILDSLNFIYPSVSNPLRVFLVCSDCYNDYVIVREELFLNSTEPINLPSVVERVTDEGMSVEQEQEQKQEQESSVEPKSEPVWNDDMKEIEELPVKNKSSENKVYNPDVGIAEQLEKLRGKD